MKRTTLILLNAFILFLSGTGCAPSTKTERSTKHETSIQASENSVTTAGDYRVDIDALTHQTNKSDAPIVYFTKDISAASLLKMYQMLGVEASGQVAVKIHTGESSDSNNLEPELIKDLVTALSGTLVECNTAYGGSRASTAMHKQVAEDRGYTKIAEVDIMDADGSMSLPVKKGAHITEDLVGSHLKNYDFCVVLSHFKGHAMAGFGGAIKNMSIGMASSEGKSLIHTGGKSHSGIGWNTPSDVFTESMVEAASAVSNYFDEGKKIVYISVMNNVSVDCDCDGSPALPDMHDVGIFASTDPVAIDQCCVDFLYQVPDGGSVIKRMQSRGGEHVFDYAAEYHFGHNDYRLEVVDPT